MKKNIKSLILVILLASISCSREGNNSISYQYPTPEDIEIFLDEIHLSYPGITSIETVGYSQSGGHVIKALIISDNPGTIEGEPAVRLTGGIHGDEKIGIELLLRFIEYITYNYGKDPAVTDMINSRYICIIPVLNPDGLESGSRYNSRGVDLNRNFNDSGSHWTAGSRSGSSAFSESESNSLKTFSAAKNFDVSVTYHTGEVLVNLPFDYGREADGIFPNQNSLVKSYAKTYTRAGDFLLNPDIYVSPYMDEGTINGGNWYIINGSLQDWSYTQTRCLDLTIEISRSDPSTEEGVEQVFIYNRDSIIAYINRAGEDTFDGL